MTWSTCWRSRRRTGVAIAALCLGLGAVFWPGRFYAEKMLTELVMPLGVIWLALGYALRSQVAGQPAGASQEPEIERSMR